MYKSFTMTLLRKYYDTGIEGGGIPDEVREKLNIIGCREFNNIVDSDLVLSKSILRGLEKCAHDGYLLASEELARLKEDNERLRGEVERTAKYGIDVLQENHQAQIAGYYNHDKTDTEREKRNAVIEEYADLIGIFKANLTPSPTKK